MDSNWDEIEDLYFRALEVDPGRRAAFLEEATDNTALRAEVGALLAAEQQPAMAIERLLPEAEPWDARFADAASAATSDASGGLTGSRIGPYRLRDVLGHGGMGEVYLAERDDDQFRRTVAVKLMGTAGARGSAELLRRFDLERRVLAQLQHPGIAQLTDAGRLEDGRPYLVMEYVPGEPITDYCDRLRLDLGARLRLFRSVCDVVQFAHAHLVIHRDLKPSNIMVVESETGEPAVKLLDFGIAKLMAPDHIDVTALETRTSARPMTPLFAAPEQFAGEPLTTATDVYALGVLLYLLLTGSPPHEPIGSAADYERQVRTGTPRRLTEALTQDRAADGTTTVAALRATTTVAALRATTHDRLQRRLQGDLERIAAMALHVDVARRYASAGQLGEDVTRFLRGEAVVAHNDTWAYRLRVFVRRNRVAVAAGVAVMVSLAVLSVFLAVQTVKARTARLLAEAQRERSEQVVNVLVDLFSTADPRTGPVGDQIPVSEFLTRVGGAVDSLGTDTELQTRLLGILGQIHLGRNEGQQALALLERAARAHRLRDDGTLEDVRRAQLGLDHAVAKAMSTVDSEKGTELLHASQAAYAKAYGVRHVETALVTVDLARVLNPSEGLPLIDEALPLLVAELGDDHVDVARALDRRAGMRAWVGMVDEARDDSETAFAIFERSLGPDHPETLQALHTHSSVLPRSDSLPVLRDLVERQERVFGTDSAAVASSMNTLGEHLARMGEVEAAARAFRRAVEIRTELYGEGSPTIGNPSRNLAMLTGLLGDYQEAADLFDRFKASVAAEKRSQTYIEIQSTYMGGRAGGTRALREAARRVEGLVAILDRIRVGDQDRYPSRARAMLAKLLLAVDRPEQAMHVAQHAHDDASQFLPATHSIVIELAFVLARARHAAAIPGAEADLRARLVAFEAMPLHEHREVVLAKRQLDRP